LIAGVLGFVLGIGVVSVDYYILAEGGKASIDPFMAAILFPGYLLNVRWEVIPDWLPLSLPLYVLLWLVGPLLFASVVAIVFVVVAHIMNRICCR